MKLTTGWVPSPDDTTLYAETDDPRVIAVIEYDRDAELSTLFDGDAINPIFQRGYLDRGRLDFVGGYRDDDIARAWTRAYQDHWATDSVAFADRFIRVFYGAEVEHTSSNSDNSCEYLIFDTPAYREHIGDVAGNVSREAVEGMSREVDHATSGDVFGVGYGVLAERVTTETDVSELFDQYDISIECWGLIGQTYAESEAAAFSYGEPELPALLPID